MILLSSAPNRTLPYTSHAYSPSILWQQTHTGPTLTATNHTVRFVHGGPSNTYIDAIDVLP
jgi:hypothetical protein